MPELQKSLSNQVLELNTEPDTLDYDNLRKIAIDLVQKYSGSVWTDYNLHDPGVTIIEALCFALTDLAYRTSFPIEDILVDANGKINYQEQSFYSVDQILNTSPLNVLDLKKVILDQVDEIQNVYLKKDNVYAGIGIRGIYDIQVQLKSSYLEHNLKNKQTEDIIILQESIEKKIRDTFSENKYLGICVNHISFLKPVELNIFAKISINKNIDPEEILAKIYYDINNYFSPIIKFNSPIDVYNKTQDLITTFDGPQLKKGNLALHKTQEVLKEINENDIISIIRSIQGVNQVNDLKIQINKNQKESFRLDEIEYFLIDHNSIENQLQLVTDEYEVKVNSTYFHNLFNELMSSNIQINHNELNEITNKNINGRYRNLNIYHTIQNHFPNIYGLGLEGISNSESDARKANLKQLKAFLTVFEQIMANYLSQLNATTALFSNNLIGENSKTFFSQSIHEITGLKEILSFFNDIKNLDPSQEYVALNKLIESLDKISESDKKFNDRKNAFLDHLLARFNISLDHFPVELFEKYYGFIKLGRLSNTLIWKSYVLQNIVEITKNRLKSSVIASPTSEDKKAFNYLNNIYTLLFINNKPCTSIVEKLEMKNFNFDVSNNESGNSNIKNVLINEEVINLMDSESIINNSQLDKLKFNDIIFEFQDETLFADACNVKNYKITIDPFGTNCTLLLFKSASNNNWRLISKFKNEAAAQKTLYLIINSFINLNINSEGIHMIENVLLKPSDGDNVFGFKLIDKKTKIVLARNSTFKNLSDTKASVIELIDKLNSFQNNIDLNSEIELSKSYEIYNFQHLIHNSDYIIEYIVQCVDKKEVSTKFFDYKMNFILPSWPARFQDKQFCKFIINTISEQLPMQIIPVVSFIGIEKMKEFEKIYFEWNNRLTQKPTKEYFYYSSLLTSFLHTL
jgi:hypothetical protein